MCAEFTSHHPSRSRLYFTIWGVLLGLTLAEVVLTWLPIGRGTILALLVTLAAVKAALVAVYFMHLRWEKILVACIALLPFPLAAGFAVVLMLENAR